MFTVGDKVVYPGHGVAIIEDVVEKMVSKNAITFLKLHFLFKDMTILVPTQSFSVTGVRYLSDGMTVDQALAELSLPPDKKLENLDLSPSGWNKRNKEYQLRIETGGLQDIARIYRDLMHISIQKELSFGEKSLLQATEELLVQEIMVVKEFDRSQVLQELRSPFKHFDQLSADRLQSETSPDR